MKKKTTSCGAPRILCPPHPESPAPRLRSRRASVPRGSSAPGQNANDARKTRRLYFERPHSTHRPNAHIKFKSAAIQSRAAPSDSSENQRLGAKPHKPGGGARTHSRAAGAKKPQAHGAASRRGFFVGEQLVCLNL